MVLYNHNLISNSHIDKKSNILYLYPYPKESTVYKTLWLNKYLYFFDKPEDMVKIESLFTNNDFIKNISYDDECNLLHIKDTYIDVIRLVKQTFRKIRKLK